MMSHFLTGDMLRSQLELRKDYKKKRETELGSIRISDAVDSLATNGDKEKPYIIFLDYEFHRWHTYVLH